MKELEFLSRPEVVTDFRPVARSPMERALADVDESLGIEDISLVVGKIEVRGEIDDVDVPDGAEIVRITPRRALFLCPSDETARVGAELRRQFRTVMDMTGALAGLRVRGERLLRRLTDLDLDALPAVGAVAHVQAIVLRDDGERFRLFFPQEYGHYLAEVVVDTAQGLT